MKKSIITFITCATTALLFTGCHRSTNVVWEDTKTCGRYMEKGLRSLFGHHIDSREYANYYESWNESEPEYEALADAESFESASLQDYGISKESPGDPGSQIPGIEGFQTPRGKLASLFNMVRFETDNYSVQGGENLSLLHSIADHLAKNPSMYVFIEGHADERGAAAYNLALGSKRANSVRSFLIQNGVNPDQLFTISYGKERPLAQGNNESVWSKNRRAQFKVYEK